MFGTYIVASPNLSYIFSHVVPRPAAGILKGMYIYCIAIDATNINAEGNLEEMNVLDQYHDAQIIDIVKTSTLYAQLNTKKRQSKSAKYRTIYSDGYYYVGNGVIPDALPGVGGNKSRFNEIYRIISKKRTEGTSEKVKIGDRRDALHIDQAMQNAVDWFVTNDNDLLGAQADLHEAGVDLKVVKAGDVLEYLQNYFKSHYGTLDANMLRAELMKDLSSHPVILGSNRTGEWKLLDQKTGEVLFFAEVIEGRLGIGAVLRGLRGELLLAIKPGIPVKFERSGPELGMMVGESHLLIGDQTCSNFSITLEGKTLLEGRVARSGHIVISRGTFRDSTGCIIATINRETLRIGRQ